MVKIVVAGDDLSPSRPIMLPKREMARAYVRASLTSIREPVAAFYGKHVLTNCVLCPNLGSFMLCNVAFYRNTFDHSKPVVDMV